MKADWLVIHHGDVGTQRVRLTDLATERGVSVADVRASLRRLVEAGELTPCARDVYDSTAPYDVEMAFEEVHRGS